MAEKRICDRCGKTVLQWYGMPVFRRKYTFLRYFRFIGEDIDLCHECSDDFDRFMRGAKVVE